MFKIIGDRGEVILPFILIPLDMEIAIISIQLVLFGIWLDSAWDIDVEHLKDHDWIEDHKSRVQNRVTFLFTLSLLSLLNPETSFIMVILNFIGFLLVFAALFDRGLNHRLGKPFYYLGSTAEWDIWWQKKKKIKVFNKTIIINRYSIYKVAVWVFFFIGIYLITL